MSSKPTLRDIAEATGVSTASVSMILNGKSLERFSSQRVASVLAEAERIGYRTPSARCSGKQIAVLSPSVSNPYHTKMITGIEDVFFYDWENTEIYNTYWNPRTESHLLDALDPRKDVDGMTTASLGALLTGAAGFAPCTAEACLHLLRAYGFDPAGRRVTVVGRSLVIGRPAALLLTRADATVTLCHRKTPGLAARCREADILLAAAGAPGLITPACVHPEQIVLDAGVTALPDGTLLGDVAAEAAGTVAACTPVPGGIGSVTTALLLLHTVQSAEIFRQF